MDWIDRIALLLKRDPPPQYQQPPGAPPPATVYVQQVPRRKISRSAMAGVAVVLVLAFFFARSAAHVSAPAQKTPEFPSFDVDWPGIQRTMANLRDSQKDAEKALREQEEVLRQRQQPGTGAVQQPGQPYQPAYRPGPTPPPAPPPDPIVERKKELAYKSLFASPVIRVQGSSEGQKVVEPVPAITPSVVAAIQPEPEKPEPAHNCLDRAPLYAICEEMIIPGRLQNKLVGELAGPLNEIIDTDIRSRDRQHILIPKGSILLGTAARTSSSYDSRLSVGFHRMLLPDGTGRDLHNAVGLDLAGETALKDKTDHHLKSTIATTVALGGLAGFSQFGAGSAFTGGGIDSYRSGISQQAGQTGQQLIGRSLNRPPTITINEGHAVNVYLSEDIRLPEFAHEVIR